MECVLHQEAAAGSAIAVAIVVLPDCTTPPLPMVYLRVRPCSCVTGWEAGMNK